MTPTTPLDETLAYLAQQVTKAETQARALMDAANVLATSDGRQPRYVITSSLPPCPKCRELTDALGAIDNEDIDPVARMEKLLQLAADGSRALSDNERISRDLKDATDLVREVWHLLGYQPGSGRALTTTIEALQRTQADHSAILFALPKNILDKHGGKSLAEIVTVLAREWAEMERHAGDWEQVAEVRALVPARFLGDGMPLKDGVRAMAKELANQSDSLRDIAHMMPDEVLASFGPDGPLNVYAAAEKLAQLFSAARARIEELERERTGATVIAQEARAELEAKVAQWRQGMDDETDARIRAEQERDAARAELAKLRTDVATTVDTTAKVANEAVERLQAEIAQALTKVPDGLRCGDDLVATVSHLSDMYEVVDRHANELLGQIKDLRTKLEADQDAGPDVCDHGCKNTAFCPDSHKRIAKPEPARRRGPKAGGQLGDVVRKFRAGWDIFHIARHLGIEVAVVEDAIKLARERKLLDAPPVAGQAAEQVEAAKAKAEGAKVERAIVDDPGMPKGKVDEIIAKLPSMEQFINHTVHESKAAQACQQHAQNERTLEGAKRVLEGATTEQPIQEPGNAATCGLRAASTEELKAEVARQQGGNKQRQARLSTTDNRKHSHEVIVDFFGDGHTVADKTGHVHRVLRFSVGNAHNHGHDLAVRS